ncbi:MAG: UpxY family transcription antiterminator [Desulfobacterales bacterium]|nr:UpxY family transcription antiterminator [Desulfobacterales bacterium]
MNISKLVPNWYVLHTKSRFENVVNEALQKKSLEVFLPKIKVPSKRRDRKLMILVPLFPGYLFVKSILHPQAHLEIVKTAGAVRLVGSKDGPVPVAMDTIESLKIMVSSGQPVATGSRFQKGDRVMVVAGPFAGVNGIFVRYRGKERVVVYIEALGQYAQVDVNAEDIEIIPKILSRQK